MIKKTRTICKFFTGVAVVCFSVKYAGAIENVVKMGGVIDFQGVYYNSNGAPSQQMVSAYQKKFGFYSGGNFFLDYQLIADNDIKYGAKIGIEQTAKNDRGVPFLSYAESKLGRIEVGADKSAGQKMKITGYSSSCATGNGWDSRVKLSPDKNKIAYVSSFCSFLDSKARTGYKSDYSRKVSYFTPKLYIANGHNIQLGISYIPDTSNAGHAKIDSDERHTPVGASPYKFVIKDGVSYGIAYEAKLADKFSVKTSFAGEKGKAIAFEGESGNRADIKFKDVNSYIIGSEVKYNNLGFSGSYMNYNKSLTSSLTDKFKLNTIIYALGAKYSFEKYSVSINQLLSDHKGNKVNATTIGMDYPIALGIKTYLQATYYQAKGKYVIDNVVNYNKNKGTVWLAGAKVNF